MENFKRNTKNGLFKVSSLASYTFLPSLWQYMNTAIKRRIFGPKGRKRGKWEVKPERNGRPENRAFTCLACLVLRFRDVRRTYISSADNTIRRRDKIHPPSSRRAMAGRPYRVLAPSLTPCNQQNTHVSWTQHTLCYRFARRLTSLPRTYRGFLLGYFNTSKKIIFGLFWINEFSSYI